MRKIVLVLITAGLLLVPTDADAHRRRFPTGGSVGANYVTETVSGKVTSSRQQCIVERLVEVTLNGAFYGQDEADSNGDWSVTGSNIEGSDDITVTVPRRVIAKTTAHRHVCGRLLTTF